jgi:hypothetical protein
MMSLLDTIFGAGTHDGMRFSGHGLVAGLSNENFQVAMMG